MKNVITAALATTFTIASMTAALAAAGETPLGNCYNHVISVCNEGNHPVSCSEAGMDACDEEFQSVAVHGIGKFKAPTPPRNTKRFKAKS